MSTHYSKFDLNTYKGSEYFLNNIPEDYPLEQVLQKSRAFRRLPPNLRTLATLSREWCHRQVLFPEDTEIEAWYDNDGYEMNPWTGQRLTDEEIDAQWNDNPALSDFVVEDIPIPVGGFANPDTWEPTPEPEEEDTDGPTEDSLVRDIGSHGREYTARYYGMPQDRLKGIKSDKELAKLLLSMRGKPWPVQAASTAALPSP